jgi:uncharacterized membrane protein
VDTNQWINKLLEFFWQNKGKIIGGIVGLIFGILFLTIGFLKTLVIVICTVIGYIIGHNFDIKKAKQFGVEGINRIYVRFKITDEGNVTDVQARSSHPKLSDEGENIIKSLPQMKPGMEKGKAVNVIYTLPITFTVPEVENNEKK